MRLLVIAESSQGELKTSTLHAISAARQVAEATAGSFDILVLGASQGQAAATAAAGYGAATVLLCEDASLEPYVAERYAATVADVARSYELALATASSFGKDLMPRVAARLDAGFAGDIAALAVEGGELRFKRPMYAGNVLAWVSLNTASKVATIRQSEFAAAAPAPASSPQQTVARSADGRAAAGVEFVSLDQVKSERPELADARVIVSGGRAVKEQFFSVLEPLADVLGAAIGASRAACDAGYAPGDYQVGQTGKIVAPELYIAVGISGAIQHIAGMKGSKYIVAINKDADAPIFQLADFGWVADLFQAVPELVTALKTRRAAG